MFELVELVKLPELVKFVLLELLVTFLLAGLFNFGVPRVFVGVLTLVFSTPDPERDPPELD